MVDIVKDEKGKVIGYIEWTIVNQLGHNKENGEYVLIRDIWIYEPERNKRKVFKELVDLVYEQTPFTLWVYWERPKYNGRKSIYKKERFREFYKIAV